MLMHNSKYGYKISLLVLIFCCWNGSLMDSNSKDKRPDLSVIATIEDHYKKFDAVDILIGNKYEQIPFYEPVKLNTIDGCNSINSSCSPCNNPCDNPCNKKNNKNQIDPRQNKILLDLQDIKSIELKHTEQPEAAKITINGRDYVEMFVTMNNGAKKPYLIEASKKVTCRELNKGSKKNKEYIEEKRELSILHIKKMNIVGFKTVKDEEKKGCRCEEVETLNKKNKCE